jgi:hypothetical protein
VDPALPAVRPEAVGTNPYHSCSQVPLRTALPRYLAMQQLFDDVGPDGRRMMRLTASLQIAVDLLPGRAGYEQWVVGNLAGPPLTAAFANSPWPDGQPVGVGGIRTRIWEHDDMPRTGYDGRHLDLLLARATDQARAWCEAAAGHSPESSALLAITDAGRPPGRSGRWAGARS